ncbi:MAG: hypothetical protein AAGA21_20755 [Pseudomonadota bacterium]
MKITRSFDFEERFPQPKSGDAAALHVRRPSRIATPLMVSGEAWAIPTGNRIPEISNLVLRKHPKPTPRRVRRPRAVSDRKRSKQMLYLFVSPHFLIDQVVPLDRKKL